MDNRYSDTSITLLARDGGLHPPLNVIISWPNSNYINPATRDWTGPIILLTAIALSTMVFVMRIWARLVVGRNFGLDDVLISLAMIPLIGLTVAAYLGKHIPETNSATLSNREQRIRRMAFSGMYGIRTFRHWSLHDRYVMSLIKRVESN